MNEEKEYDVGVIVGRFHTPQLHESHKKLFDYVCSRHRKVICYLGLSPLKCTKRNPLDFHQRKVMINEDYPDVQCFYIKDTKKNDVWSKQLDSQISDMLMPLHAPLLYGSRDSFISSYEGRFDTEELESDSFISASRLRQETTRDIMASKDVRVGMIIAAASRFPTAFTTVDIAIMDKDRTRILLGRKQDEKKFRFIGGFADPDSERLEDDAIRETKEETNIDISEPTYICSMKIDDWRYRSEDDCIKTTFWIADRIGGYPEAADDIIEVKWFDITSFEWRNGGINEGYNYDVLNIVRGHQDLMVTLLDYLKK